MKMGSLQMRYLLLGSIFLKQTMFSRAMMTEFLWSGVLLRLNALQTAIGNWLGKLLAMLMREDYKMTDGNEGHNRKENIRRRLDVQPMGLKERLISIIPRSKDWCDNASKKRITTIAGAVVVAIGLGWGIVKYSNYSNERRLELQIGEKGQEISELKDRKSALDSLYTTAQDSVNNLAKTNRDIAAVAQREKASLDSIRDVADRLEARAVNAESLINNARQIAKSLEGRTYAAEAKAEEYLKTFPYEIKSLALEVEEGLQNGKSVVVLGFEERYSEEPK